MGIQIIVNAHSDDVRVDPESVAAGDDDGDQDDAGPPQHPKTNPRNRGHLELYVSPWTRVGDWDRIFRR